MALTRKGSANLLGSLSVLCSLVPLVLILRSKIVGGFPTSLNLSFTGVIHLWEFGLLLAFIASFFGSRWWALAVLLTIVSIFGTLAFTWS